MPVTISNIAVNEVVMHGIVGQPRYSGIVTFYAQSRALEFNYSDPFVGVDDLRLAIQNSAKSLIGDLQQLLTSVDRLLPPGP